MGGLSEEGVKGREKQKMYWRKFTEKTKHFHYWEHWPTTSNRFATVAKQVGSDTVQCLNMCWTRKELLVFENCILVSWIHEMLDVFPRSDNLYTATPAFKKS